MKLVTRQGLNVIDTLKHNKTYKSNYYRDGFAEQYKALQEFLGMSSCPIFCLPLEYERKFLSNGVSGSTGMESNSTRIVLEVPNDECHTMEYYDWSEFIYYTREDDDGFLGYTREESLKHIDKYLGKVNNSINSYDYPQVVIDRIEPQWVVSKEAVKESSDSMTIQELDNSLRKAYSKETCHPSYRDKWSKDNPTAGHCAIVSLIVNDVFGYPIYNTFVGSSRHFYNINGKDIIDLTKDQFNGVSVDYTKGVERNRKDLLKNKDTKERYELLKDAIDSNAKALEEAMSGNYNIPIYRVNSREGEGNESWNNDVRFFAGSLDYFDKSDTGYDKKDAKEYLLNIKDFKVFDPMKLMDLEVDTWSTIWGTIGEFDKYGVYWECEDEDLDEDDPDYMVYTSTDDLAYAGKDLGYDVTILRDIPNDRGWGNEYTEYAVHNSRCIKSVNAKSFDKTNNNINEKFEEIEFGNENCHITNDINDIVRDIKKMVSLKAESKYIIDDNLHRYIELDPWFMIHDDAFDLAINNGWYPELCWSNERIEGKIPYDEYVEKGWLDGTLQWIKMMPLKDGETSSGYLGEEGFSREYIYDGFSILTREDFEKCSLYKALGTPKEVLNKKKPNPAVTELDTTGLFESTLYRGVGAVSGIPRYLSQYTGTFYTKDEGYASMYGKVKSQDIDDDLNLYNTTTSSWAVSELHLSDYNSASLKEFTKKYITSKLKSKTSAFGDFLHYSDGVDSFSTLSQWNDMYEIVFGEDWDENDELYSFNEWLRQIVLKDYLSNQGYDGIEYSEEDGANQVQIWKQNVVKEDLSQGQDLSKYYDEELSRQLDKMNKFLDKYGFEVELVDDEECLQEIKDNSAVGMFFNSIQDNASVFPIGFNKEMICNESENTTDVYYGIVGTLAHEVGHGIFEYCNDMMDLDDLDEEEVVEEFARDYEDNYWKSNELMNILKQTLDEQLIYNYGDNKKIVNRNSLTWFTPEENYAKSYGKYKHTMDIDSLDNYDILDIGEIGNPVWNNGKYTKEFKDFCKKIEMTPNQLISYHKLMGWGDNFLRGTEFIYDITVEEPFARLLRELGYDGVKATESGVTTYGLLSFEDNIIEDSLDEGLDAIDSEGNKLTQDQINFFKDSKVRDNNGNLLVVYHGTTSEFDVFDVEQSWDYFGFHFGTRAAADSRNASVTMKCYINIKNPLTLPDLGDWGAYDFSRYFILENPKLGEELLGVDAFGYLRQSWEEDYEYTGEYDDMTGEWNNEFGDNIRDALYNSKYDGIKYTNEVEDRGSVSYMCFYSNQIKSIENKNPSNSDNINEDLTQGQLDYFKDSKVRDKDGNLLVCYHGTHTPGFKEFDASKGDSKFGKYKFNDKYNVNYFTTDRKSAASYTEFGYENNGNVYACYVNIINPYVVDNKTEAEIKSSFNIKDDTLRKHQIEMFDKVFDKWRGRYVSYGDKAFKELNNDLRRFNVELRPYDGYENDVDPDDIEYFDLFTLGNNSLFGAEHPIMIEYSVDELFDDSMYDELREEILGVSEEYGEDDYYFTTDDVVRYVLSLNETEGTNYDGILIPDIVDSMEMFSMKGTDVITLNSSSQIKLIDNPNPTDSKRIDEEDEDEKTFDNIQEVIKDILG